MYAVKNLSFTISRIQSILIELNWTEQIEICFAQEEKTQNVAK